MGQNGYEFARDEVQIDAEKITVLGTPIKGCRRWGWFGKALSEILYCCAQRLIRWAHWLDGTVSIQIVLKDYNRNKAQ